jgi:hypothetical protein
MPLTSFRVFVGNRLVGYEDLDVINPESGEAEHGQTDAEDVSPTQLSKAYSSVPMLTAQEKVSDKLQSVFATFGITNCRSLSYTATTDSFC